MDNENKGIMPETNDTVEKTSSEQEVNKPTSKKKSTGTTKKSGSTKSDATAKQGTGKSAGSKSGAAKSSAAKSGAKSPAAKKTEGSANKAAGTKKTTQKSSSKKSSQGNDKKAAEDKSSTKKPTSKGQNSKKKTTEAQKSASAKKQPEKRTEIKWYEIEIEGPVGKPPENTEHDNLTDFVTEGADASDTKEASVTETAEPQKAEQEAFESPKPDTEKADTEKADPQPKKDIRWYELEVEAPTPPKKKAKSKKPGSGEKSPAPKKKHTDSSDKSHEADTVVFSAEKVQTQEKERFTSKSSAKADEAIHYDATPIERTVRAEYEGDFSSKSFAPQGEQVEPTIAESVREEPKHDKTDYAKAISSNTDQIKPIPKAAERDKAMPEMAERVKPTSPIAKSPPAEHRNEKVRETEAYDEVILTDYHPEKKRELKREHKERIKRRKKQERGGKFLRKTINTFSYIIVILGISLAISAFGLMVANDVFALISSESDIVVTLNSDMTFNEVADILVEEEVINYAWVFKLFAGLKDNDDDEEAVKEEIIIKAGSYTLQMDMDYGQIYNAFANPAKIRETVNVTVAEGLNLRQIADLMEKNKVCDSDTFIEVANTYDFSHTILQDIPMIENRLEGYLFPDTYQFYTNDSAVNVINKMLNNFVNKYTPELRKLTDEREMTMADIVIIASLIEREAKLDDERVIISGVIYNRLNNTKSYPTLDIDATLLYGFEHKEVLTEEDKLIDSPYNTYMYSGLPPTAICNPGISSIFAAISPESHSYYFYVLENAETGEHVFSKNLSEHNANIARIRNAGN